MRGAGGDVQRLAIHLCQTLGGTHDTGRVDRLVGGDQHHRQGARRSGRVGDMAGAGGVGGHALQRGGFDHRHMLQCSGVKHQLRPMVFENCSDSRLVPDVGDQGAAVHLRVGLGELEVDLPQRVLTVVEQNQGAGAEGGDLPGELTADRAAGAGNDDASALDQPRHSVAIERHLRTVEQVLDDHRAKFNRARLVGVGERGRARGLADLQAELVGLGDDLGEARPGQLWRDEHQRAG